MVYHKWRGLSRINFTVFSSILVSWILVWLVDGASYPTSVPFGSCTSPCKSVAKEVYKAMCVCGGAVNMVLKFCYHKSQ